MSDGIEVCGGRFASTRQWLKAVESTGCRAAFKPRDRSPVLGGEPWLRFQHPSIAKGREVAVQVSVRIVVPAADAPKTVVAQRQNYLRELREQNAPLTLRTHEAMVVGWLTGGREGVLEALVGLIEVERRAGATKGDLVELERSRTYWKKRSAAFVQSVLFDTSTRTRAGLLATRILAIAYAAAAGGRVKAFEDLPGCEAGAVDRMLPMLAAWEAAFAGRPPKEVLFNGWENLPG